MRIIVVNDHGHVTGGADQVAIASLNALADAGHDVTFVSSVPPIDVRINTSKIRVVNFGFHSLLSNPSRLKAAFNGLWDFRCSREFESLLDEYDTKNTLIHFHTWTKSLSPSIFQHALGRKFKTVITLHDYFSICPNGGMYNYQTQQHCLKNPMSVDCALTHCDSRSYSHKQWRFFRQLFQNIFSGIPNSLVNFISISDYSENILKPNLPPTARFFRVQNPIDIPYEPFPNRSSTNGFAYVGRLSAEKGAHLFASASFMAKVPAIFVGHGSEAGLIRGLNPDASLLGWQNRDGVISNMRGKTAIVFPSLWHETQGLVVSEAAALGIPSIVSRDCAASESIVDGETGFLFERGDVNSLKKMLLRLHSDSELSIQMGKSAYKRYWSNPLTIENHVQGLLICYYQIMSENF